MVTLHTWRERMSEDMRLRDFRPRTQGAYRGPTWRPRGSSSTGA